MSKITFEKVNEIIEKEYETYELSLWEKMINQALSGNIGYFLTEGTNDLLRMMDVWINGTDDSMKGDDNESDTYTYNERMEERINKLYEEWRVYKEMNRK